MVTLLQRTNRTMFLVCALSFLYCQGTNGEASSVETTTDSGGNTESLDYCTVNFTNKTGYLLDQAQFFPTDFVGILTEFEHLPIEQNSTITMRLPVGTYQLKVNNREHNLFFTSYDHNCVADQILNVTATLEDLRIGAFKVINKCGYDLNSVILASTEDLTWGDNRLAGPLEDGDELLIDKEPGSFYWLLEDSEGSTYFGSSKIEGSSDGAAVAHADSREGREFCILSLTNNTGVTLDYIAIHDGVGEAHNDQFFDSRGNLPDSETLDILIAPGAWGIIATWYDGARSFEIPTSSIVCEDESPLSATLNSEDMRER